MNTSAADSTPTERGATGTTDGTTAGTGGAYRTTAVILALIVAAALAYGLVQTALKASALFTG